MKVIKIGAERAGEEARLALCGVELKALKQWRAARFNKHADIHHVAHYAMLFALTNPKKFMDWTNNVARYCDAEGLHDFAHMRSRMTALYSTRKLKIAGEQLQEPAHKINPKPKRAKPVPRGFFLVNLAQWQQDELRRMARECGVELRTMIHWSITRLQCELREKIKIARTFGLKPSECCKYIHSNPRN